MTVQEAEKAGMSDIDIALGIVTGELEDESEPDEYRDPVHGRIADNKISVEELPNWSLGSWEKAIGADCTETVKTQIMYDLFREPVVMIVDESGLVKNREVNAVGSFLYGIQNHGTPIVRDIIFGLQNGPEILPLADAELVKFFLKDHFPLLEEVQK